MKRIVLAVLLLVASSLTTCTADRSPPERTTSPAALRTEIADHLAGSAMEDVRAVLVIADDRTVVEEYYGSTAQESRDVFSVTKSVMSTLVGIAVDEGRLALDDQLGELLPGYGGAMTPEVAGTTLEQLLTMTGGFLDTSNPSRGESVFAEADWVAACLGSANRPPGQRFAYSDPGAHLVAAVLAEATGSSVLDYAADRLLGPLGIDTDAVAEPLFSPESIAEYEAADIAWPLDPQGVHAGFGGLKLRPRDMAALGSLYLDGGTADGRRIVSADWTREATTRHVPARGLGDGYGYLWWVGESDGSPAYMAIGYGGQLVEVVPDRQLVVVVSTDVGLHATVDPRQATYLVDRVIAPAFRPG